jgi:hypothetical protein
MDDNPDELIAGSVFLSNLSQLYGARWQFSASAGSSGRLYCHWTDCSRSAVRPH